MAPHIVRPLRFVLPQGAMSRPGWIVRLGLFVYDHLGGRKLLPPTGALDLATDAAGEPLKASLRGHAFEYSDCWIDDAWLVALNARDAADRGAAIRTRTKAVAAERRPSGWSLTTEDQRTGARATLEAGILVNAAGPWVDDVLGKLGRALTRELRLVQGCTSWPAASTATTAAISCKIRTAVIFAISYEDDFTLIGTTDRDYTGDPANVSASPEEIAYLARLRAATSPKL